MRRVLFFWLLILVVFSVAIFDCPGFAVAAINEKINYQGKLTDDSDVAVSDGNYSIVFSLYTTLTGGANIWTETQSVAVTNGLFSVMLGTTTSLASVDFDQTLYLGVNVEGDGEMTPRRQLGAVPAAFVAKELSDFVTPFAAQLAATTTDALAQGSTNRYYSDTLVNTFVHASSTIPKTYSANTWSGLNSFNYASSTAFSALDALFVGRTSTTTIRGDSGTSTFSGFIDVLGTGTNATSTFSANLWVKGALQVGTGSIHLSDTGIAHSGGSFSISSTATSTLSNLGFVVGTNQLAVQSGTSYVGIGTTTPSEKLTLTGGNFRQIPENPTLVGSTAVGGTPAGLDVVANRAYVVDQSSVDLKIFDVSTSTPALITSVALAATPRSVAVAGSYAYVGDDGVKIFDITLSPPVLVGTLATTTPRALFAQGRYLYAAAEGSTNSFYIADVSNPTSPQVTGYLTTGYIDSVVVYGTYAYVTTAASGSGNSYIIDVANPTAPFIAKTISLGAVSSSAVIEGAYAYTVSSRVSGLNTLTELKIIKASPVDSAAVISTLLLNTDASLGAEPVRIRVAGRYAYITDANVGANNGELTIVDIYNPVNPVIVGELTFTPSSGSITDLIPDIAGRYLYILESSGGDKLHKIDISGAEFTSALAHTFEAGAAQIRDDLFVGNQLKVGGGLNVGIGGIYSSGPLAVGVASTTLSNPISAYFAGRVGVGSSTPSALLSVGSSGGKSAVFEDDVIIDGNLGIGTSTPFVSFSLERAIDSNYVSYIVNSQTGSTDNKAMYVEAWNRNGFVYDIVNSNTAIGQTQKGLRIKINTTNNANVHFVGFSHNGTMGGMIQGNGSGGVTYTTTGSDYAEYFLAADFDSKPEPGDLVSWSPTEKESVEKTRSLGDERLIGVVSTAPGFIGNATVCPGDDQLDDCNKKYADQNVLVALAGRVPTKVNLEGGPIAIGDRISASSVAGVGKKASADEANIGFALEEYDGGGADDHDFGLILTFINLQSRRLDPSLNAFGQSPSPLLQVQAIQNLANNWEISEDGILRVREVRTERLCLGDICVGEKDLKTILEQAGLIIDPPESESEPDLESNLDPDLEPDPEPESEPETEIEVNPADDKPEISEIEETPILDTPESEISLEPEKPVIIEESD